MKKKRVAVAIPEFDPGYITIRYQKTQKLFVLAGTIILYHFKKSIITRHIDDAGRVTFD